MLPKKNRVNRKKILEVFKEGKFLSVGHLSLKYMEAKPPSKSELRSKASQFAFIVPRAVSKKAVERNLLKRRGYAVIAKYLTQFPAGFVGVVFFGRSSLKIFGGRKNKNYNPGKNLENEIQKIIHRLY
jgi:ribonuclease P protein component